MWTPDPVVNTNPNPEDVQIKILARNTHLPQSKEQDSWETFDLFDIDSLPDELLDVPLVRNKFGNWFIDPRWEKRYAAWISIDSGRRIFWHHFFFFGYTITGLFFNFTTDFYPYSTLEQWHPPGRVVYNIVWIFLLTWNFGGALVFLIPERGHRLLLSIFGQERYCDSYITGFIIFALLIFPFGNRWRMIRIFDMDIDAFKMAPKDQGYASDMVTYATLLVYILAATLYMPTRFHQCVYVGTIAIFSVIWTLAYCDSPALDSKAYNMCFFFFNLGIIFLVKYNLDTLNRDVFVRNSQNLKSVKILQFAIQQRLSPSAQVASLSKLESAREKLYHLMDFLLLSDDSWAEHVLDVIKQILDDMSNPSDLLTAFALNIAMEPTGDSSVDTTMKQFFEENFTQHKIREGSKSVTSRTGTLFMDKKLTDFDDDEDNCLPLTDAGNGLLMEIDTNNFGQDWKFNIREVHNSIKNRTLVTLAPKTLMKYAKCHKDKIMNFTNALGQAYNDMPYHNEAHAAQVLSHATYLARVLRVTNESTTTEKFAFHIATISHDVGHFGRTNFFCMSTKAEVAITYNDRSVLENMHAAMAFRIMNHPSRSILDGFEESDILIFRALVIEYILATDMSKNQDALAAFRVRSDVPDFSMENADDRRMSYCLIIKASDIGHGALPWEQHEEWSYKLCQEFFEQGDAEKELGMPISALCDRDTVDFKKCQLGFLQYCCKPLFELLIILEKTPSKADAQTNNTPVNTKASSRGIQNSTTSMAAQSKVMSMQLSARCSNSERGFQRRSLALAGRCSNPPPTLMPTIIEFIDLNRKDWEKEAEKEAKARIARQTLASPEI